MMTTTPQAGDLRKLVAAGEPQDKTYVLIDPFVGEPLPGLASHDANADLQAAREDCWQRQIARIDLPSRIPIPIHKHPYLVLSCGADDPLLQISLELSTNELKTATVDGLDGTGSGAHRIGGWLQSNATPEQFSAELAPIFRVNTARFTKAKYFRVADRRVLALLRHVVGDRKVMGQVASLNRWIYLDTQGSLSQLVRRDEGHEVLRLTCPEWDRMQRGEAISRTSAQWLGEVVRTRSDNTGLCKPTSELYTSLELAVDEALRASREKPERFTTISDQTAYATLSLLYPGFARCAAIIEFLEEQDDSEAPAEPMRFLASQLLKILDSSSPSSQLN